VCELCRFCVEAMFSYCVGVCVCREEEERRGDDGEIIYDEFGVKCCYVGWEVERRGNW